MDDYKDYLNASVLQENRPITYKSLARTLKIHVDTAKQALYTFATENQTKVHAVYCITGQLITTKQFTIQLVKSTELEESKKLFKSISGVHVYSVTSYDPIDFSVLYAACKDTPKLSLEERYACGVLKNPTVEYVKHEKSRAVQTNTNKPVTAAPKAQAPASKPAPTLNKPKKGTLSFASAKKTNTKKDPVEKKTVAKGVKRKTNHDEAIEDRFAKTSIKVQDIFSDDEEEEEESKAVPEVEDAMEVDDIIDEVTENMGSDAEDKAPTPKPSTPERSPSPAPPGKAKRKVLKKKTTMNARGHMVTEEVWEWEEVDEAEVQERKPAAPKAMPAKSALKKATGSKKAPAQTNLFSFFNKK